MGHEPERICREATQAIIVIKGKFFKFRRTGRRRGPCRVLRMEVTDSGKNKLVGRPHGGPSSSK
jgi:hypothetical protein